MNTLSKKYAVNWSIWIGLVVGIYSFLYILSPLNKYEVMPCTFVGLPLFFIAGAKKEEILDFCSSAIMGVIWGLIFIYGIVFLLNNGVSAAIANASIIFLITAVLCAFHFIVTPKILLSKVPMMFGAISSTFFAGADKWPALMVTLCFGILLAYICQCGTLLLNEKGDWKFMSN